MFRNTGRKGWAAFALAVALVQGLVGCGGGSDDATPAPAGVAVPYQAGDLAAYDSKLPAVTRSLESTTGALMQAIYAVNSFAYTDTQITGFATYQKRQADAIRALDVLVANAARTEAFVNALPDIQGAKALQVPAVPVGVLPSSASPSEVLAVLNSSKSRWPIKTLMEQYQVSAKRAQLILNNAMAGLTSEAYTEQATVENQVALRLTLVRDASALTVGVGATALTAGAAGGALTAWEATTAVVGATDAIIKVSKAGADLYIGQEGALDDTVKKSLALRTLAGAAELLAIQGLFARPTDVDDAAGAAVNNLVYVTGKISEFFQEKKISFGAESVSASDIDEAIKQSMIERVKALKFPAQYPGTYRDDSNNTLVVDRGVFPPLVLEALAKLPVSDQLDAVKQLLPEPEPEQVSYDGVYSGVATTTYEAPNAWCWDTSEISVSVSGATLGGDVTGTLSGNRVSGTDTSYGMLFSGLINGPTMSGTWADAAGDCSGTFTLVRN